MDEHESVANTPGATNRPTGFDGYADAYQSIRMRREAGILEMRFHTDDGPLRWGAVPHEELGRAFRDVGRDRENGVVILTGTGAEWSGPQVSFGPGPQSTAQDWDRILWEGKQLVMNLLDIDVPVISAINGPIFRHAEVPLLSDIVLAAEEATIQDSAHFNGTLVPGDGVHVLFPLIMGPTRGRYFLLTGQTLSALEAKDVGLFNEVLPCEEVLPRAWTLARDLMARPELRRRYARALLTQDLKRRFHELLGYGLALEGLAATEG